MQRLLAQHVQLAQQYTQRGRLRVDHDAPTGETRAARKQLVAGRANREQLTDHLAEAARCAEAEVAKLKTVNAELIETDTSLASAVSAVHGSCGGPIVGQRLADCSSMLAAWIR